MPRILLYISALFLLAFNFGCSSSSSAQNSEVTASSTPTRVAPANGNTNANVTVIQPMANNNGRPANLANGAPIPGIDPGNAVRTLKPGEKIPGIPDQETIKRQMNTPVDPNNLPPEFRRALNSNANVKVNPNGNVNASPSMMRKAPSNTNASPSMMRKAPSNTNASPSMMRKKGTE